MRRSDREIKDFDEIIEIIEQCDVCRVALNDEEYPYIIPLNFGMQLEDGQIVLYFHGATEGKKYDLMKKDGRATFEMDCEHRLVTREKNGSCSCTMEYKSVIGTGTMEIVPVEGKYEALCILMKHYHEEEIRFDTAVMAMTNVFKLTVQQITGKKRICS